MWSTKRLFAKSTIILLSYLSIKSFLISGHTGNEKKYEDRGVGYHMEFFQVKTREEVLEILARFSPVGEDLVDLNQALGRVVAKEITSPEDLPPFPRATMDGYAVRARDTFGASESMPALFNLTGEIPMGQSPKMGVKEGETLRILTGGMLPDGADAVVMLEYAQVLDEKTVELTRPVSPLEHVIQTGEDVGRATPIFSAGRRLKPQDLGMLAALGITKVLVFNRPRVAILSSGDEVVSPLETPPPGKIRDINAITLAAQVEAWGGIPFFMGIVRDRFDELKARLEEALSQADLILISGGSSVGSRDYTLRAIQSLKDARILVHGIAISPGKPTIIAQAGKTPLFGLPGHAASSLIVSLVFVKPLLLGLGGEVPGDPDQKPPLTLKARLTRNCPSAQGREEYVRVRLFKLEGAWQAEPIFGKSGLISPLVRAQGMIVIPLNEEGMEEGTLVEVNLF
jgi:molybdopterin molybdotransferase